MSSVGLPDPELYIVVSGNPSKQKILWQSMVNVAHVTAAIKNLKQINWLYAQGRRNRYGHYGHGRTTFSAFHLYNHAVNVAIIPLSPNIAL